jgi:predicted Zn-dependent protease
VYHDRALVEEAYGDVSAAERDEAFALRLRPEYAAAQANLAEVLWKEGRRKEALGLLEKLSAAHPEQEEIVVRLSDAYADLSEYAAAERSLRSLIAREPASPVWHRRLSRLLAGEGLAAEAKRESDLAERLGKPAPKARSLRRLPESKR